MKYLRDGLIIGGLFIACIVGLQISYLLTQASKSLGDTATSAGSVLSKASATLDLSNTALKTQQGYYRDSASHVKALTKAAAIDAIRFGRLLDDAGAHLERISSAAEASLDSARAAASALAVQTEAVGNESRTLLQAGTETTRSVGDLARDSSIKKSLENLETSSENLNKTTVAAEEAMGYIRDMLSPTKKSFWRRVLELLIPRPTVRVP